MQLRHPLVEFIGYIALLLYISFSLNPVGIGVVLVGLLVIKPKSVPIVAIIILLTTIVNPLVNHKGETYLFYLNDNIITLESIIYGVLLGCQVSCLILGFKLMSDNMTSEKIISVTSYLFPPVSLLLSMAVRSLGKYSRKTKEVYLYQKTFSDKTGFFRRIIICINTFSIMVGWILENSIETADSMMCRGYGSARRTTFRKVRINRNDILEILFIILLFIGFYITIPKTIIVPYLDIGLDIINIIVVTVFIVYEVFNERFRCEYKTTFNR